MAGRRTTGKKQVTSLRHDKATRRNIPTAEQQSFAERMEETAPTGPATYARSHPHGAGETRERDTDLDPQLVWKGTSFRLTGTQVRALQAGERVELEETQLVWRGKDQQDWSDLVVQVPPIYVQEKIHPKAIIDGLKSQTSERQREQGSAPDLFGDFNGLEPEARTEFYCHDQNWQNRLILGDSLQVMASLAEREALRGKVQCIYFDPPYGIKFTSNWQVSTRSRDVKDGKLEHITREPEQVKAFRDTWKDGIHSYLSYLRDRLTVMRDLLTDSGSIFVQIGDENVHRVRSLMDEVFGEENYIREIVVSKTSSQTAAFIPSTFDTILFYARQKQILKFRNVFNMKGRVGGEYTGKYSSYWRGFGDYITGSNVNDREGIKYPLFRLDNTTSQSGGDTTRFEFLHCGKKFLPGSGGWKSNLQGFSRLQRADRLYPSEASLSYVRFLNDFPIVPIGNFWTEISGAVQSRSDPKVYVVQTSTQLIQRCLLMATDPGDLVLDPTCGSGTTASVAEQWGRRWITIDTSRVALALARTRLMSAKYPFYYLADSPAGQKKEVELTGKPPPDSQTLGDIRQGFVYQRVPHVTLKSIANNAEIDVIWETHQPQVEAALTALNQALAGHSEPFAVTQGARKGQTIDFTARGEDSLPSGEQAPRNGFMEWEVPRDAPESWPETAREAHAQFWQGRIARQQEIDQSIARHAATEYLYDKPYEDTSKVRVAGPFTVESLSPHRVIPANESELIDEMQAVEGNSRALAPGQDFASVVLENLKTAGVQQSAKQNRLSFTAIEGWPGEYIAATGTYEQDDTPKRAAIFIGPEFGSITRTDIMAAAREANESRFDVLVACGFNFDAHSSEVSKLGPLPILKARMNPDLHMADDLKNTGKGNLFIVFGEPDIVWGFDDAGDIIVEVEGIDVFDPKTGEVRASGKEDIAAWFIDTDYNEESFFVRHAYFLGANEPYKALKASLKAEIDMEAWTTLYSDKSRPFKPPSTGSFAVKVINHFGDEVMKVFQCRPS